LAIALCFKEKTSDEKKKNSLKIYIDYLKEGLSQEEIKKAYQQSLELQCLMVECSID
tara:strand:- start:366 stop:536 length:171 start_codon:yes stop_codon:yes gene_type:complete